MKLQSAWPTIAVIAGGLAFFSWSFASSQVESPVVSSTTEPYSGFHDFEISGITKITTESYKHYTVRTELTNAQSVETPPKKWRTYKFLTYKDLHGALLKWGLAGKDVGFGTTKSLTHKALLWHDSAGVENYIACDDLEYTNGNRNDQRIMERDTVNPKNLFHTAVGGFYIKIDRDENGTVLHEAYQQFEPGKDHFRKVHWVQDTTGCDDPKFPFQLLKEKPL